MTVAAELPGEAREFIERADRLFVNGEWTEPRSHRRFATLDPGTGETLAEVAEADAEDVDQAVGAAAGAFPAWRALPGSDRGRLLWKLADLVEEHLSELAALESLDNGKPLSISRGFDIPMAAATLRYFAGWAGKVEGRLVPPAFPQRGNHQIVVAREPLGVVAAIVPWNMPTMLAGWKLGPALAFGNTVVLKPAEETPLTALRIAELAAEAGFPPGVLNVVTGPGELTGAALAKHPTVAKISFTGSTDVGREILAGSAADFKRVSLELGGKSATIVFADAADADLRRAASQAAWAVYTNAGQICAAGSRLLVEEAAYEMFLDAVANVARRIKVGYCLSDESQIGPLISERQLERVRGFVDRGRVDCELIAGGDRIGDRGYFFQPTLFGDVECDSPLWTEEIFGPVLCATRFTTVEEAIELANASRYGLAAGIFTKDLARAQAVASQLRAGTVWINTYNLVDPAVPWGGFKESGFGRDNGRSSVDLYTEEKVVWTSLDS